MGHTNLNFLDERLSKEREYWLQQLAGPLPVSGLPLDYRRPPRFSGARASVEFEFAAETQRRVAQVCGGNETLVLGLLVAALDIYLYKATGNEDVLVGTAIHARHGEVAALNRTLALRSRVHGGMQTRELLLAVKQTLADAYLHQKYPFERLLDLLGVEAPENRAPLFNVAVLLENVNDPRHLAESKQDATLIFRLEGGALAGRVEYGEALFRRDSVEAFVRQFETILGAALEAPDRCVDEIDPLTPERRRQLLQDFNQTAADYPSEKTVHVLFEEQARRTPDEVALSQGREDLTYAELDARANRLANHLLGLGVGAGARVGVLLEHSVHTLVTLFGILKTGAAYVPLDPSHPRRRLLFTLEDAEVAALVTTSAQAERLDAKGLPCVVRLDADDAAIGAASSASPGVEAQPSAPAYLIYTSGSTGQPKGVVVSQRSLVNYICWARGVYLRGERLACALYTSLAFDLTVTSIFMPLVSGGRVVVFGGGAQAALSEVFRDPRVELVKLTPSHLSLIKGQDNSGSNVRRLIVGGEAFESRLAREVAESFGREVEIYNEYGPTEATVGCMIHLFDGREDREAVPIGRPAANTQIYVLDEQMRPTAENIPGELYIGGDSLAQGYWRREELTHERFVANPHRPGELLYRTGDFARHLPSGVVEYIGRRDAQVKYHGHRVELNEIASVLNRHTQVRDSVIVIRQDGRGHDVMIAYYAARQSVPSEELRAHLAESIYAEVLPSVWVHLKKLPLTLNGKVNYEALPSLEEARGLHRKEYAAPRTPAEEIICGIYADLLGLPRVGAEDSFFELGGHSLLAMQVVARLRQSFGFELALRTLFEAPTPALLAPHVELAGDAGLDPSLRPPPLLRMPRREGEPLPASFAQQRLWFIHQLDPHSAAYNVPVALRLEGRLDVAALRRTLTEVVRRHESLRTRFVERGGEPFQVVEEARALALPVVDLSGLGEERARAEALREAEAEGRRAFRLAEAPLARARLVRVKEGEYVALWTMHHIVADGWSIGVLVKEVAALYAAFVRGAESPLTELAVQYADYAGWQKQWLAGEALEAQLRYWREQLADVPAELILPRDRTRAETAGGSKGATEPLELGEALSEGLRALARREGATLFMVLMAGFQALLHRYSGQTDICVGTPLAGRRAAETEGLIGFFVNMLPVRARVNGALSFAELLREVREQALGAYAHQDAPFERVVEEVQPERVIGRPPVFQTLFVWQNAPREEFVLSDLTFNSLYVNKGLATFDLVLNLAEAGDNIEGLLDYNSDLFDATTVRRMVGHLLELLAGAAADPTRPLNALPLLTQNERRQLLSDWNDTAVTYPDAHTPVHLLFERQADLAPTNVALRFRGTSLTYAELDKRANRLAHYLRSKGVGPDTIVALCLERTMELPLAILAVLKAGGAYLPLDPTHPAERLALVLGDAHPRVLLTQSRLQERLPEPEGYALLSLDTDWEAQVATQPATRPACPVTPANIAYVIYTSGSTGAPKGVMSTHGGLSNRLLWMQEQYQLTSADAVLQKTPYTFDVSVWELLWPLMTGAREVVAEDGGQRDARYLAEEVMREGVTVLHFVPSMLGAFLDEVGAAGGCESLRVVVCSGEALAAPLAARCLRELSQARLENLYGPTEASIDVTRWGCTMAEAAAGRVSIGSAIANTQVYVLDGRLEPVPVGVSGELYLAGVGLARGYLKRPGLTGERFVPDPYSGEAGARMYRTGDLVWRAADGEIEYAGRADGQIKLRGYRIELGEIESAMCALAGVREAVAVVRGEGAEKRLVGYVVREPGAEGLNVRQGLLKTLPEYMVPSAFIELDRLPRLSSGKLDRKALPDPEPGPVDGGAAYEAPRGPLELALARMWEEVLKVERVGVRDNFFDLGGHSLLLTQLVSRIRKEFEVELPLRLLFNAPTIVEVADLIVQEQAARRDAAEVEEMIDELRQLTPEELRALLASEGALTDAQL